MASNNKQDREARARLRAYQARQQVHQHRMKRRTRDNIIAAVSLVVVFALAIGAQLLYFNGGPGTPEAVTSTSATPTPTPTSTAATGKNVGDVPDVSVAENREWSGTMTLNDIPLGITLDGTKAPQAVASFVSLSKKGFFDGTTCHRLTTDGLYVLQCGDPTGTGTGGPGYSFGPIENAPADGTYTTGMLAMANSGDPYSNGSQFFIVYKDSKLAPNYTVFGEVTSGLDTLQTKVISGGVKGGGTDGAPAVTTKITSVTVK